MNITVLDARYYKDTDPKLYEYLSSGNTIKVRCVKVELETGEIEINNRHLKNDLKIENITSSKEVLIKQDIYSQVLVSNMLQAFINENINQTKYKNKMKTNTNMSVGTFKNTLIYILLENNEKKRSEMMDKFCLAIEKYIIPVKPGRKNKRNNNPKNRYHVNQRKTF